MFDPTGSQALQGIRPRAEAPWGVALGVGELDLDTYGLDISASKGFAFLTPYIGVGQVWIKSSSNVSGLSSESLSKTKAFAGLKVKMMLLSLVGEVQTAEFLSYSLRANISF